MRIELFLKTLSPVFIAVGLMHLFLGPNAEVLLGADLSQQSITDPVLDSQNRFYGVVFALYGALFYLCATDLHKYKTVLHLLLLFFFAGGMARIVSIFAVGLPSAFVFFLLLSELTLPILIVSWLKYSNK